MEFCFWWHLLCKFVTGNHARNGIGVQHIAIGHCTRSLNHTDRSRRSSHASVAVTSAQSVFMPQEVLADDPSEGVSEITYSVGVYKRVNYWISMWKYYGQVHDPVLRSITLWTEQCEAVNNMQREPTNSKEAHNDSQRFGRVDFPLQRGPRWVSLPVGIALQVY